MLRYTKGISWFFSSLSKKPISTVFSFLYSVPSYVVIGVPLRMASVPCPTSDILLGPEETK